MNKKGTVSLVAYLIVAVMAVVSLVVYISNVGAAYYQDMNGSVVVMMAIALAAVIGVLVLARTLTGKVGTLISDALRVATPALILVCSIIFVGMRLESFGYIFGSNLELGNQAAFDAGTQAITGIVLFVVTWVVSVVASFLKSGSSDA